MKKKFTSFDIMCNFRKLSENVSFILCQNVSEISYHFSALHSTRWRIIAMGFDIRVRQYWELLKILKMFTIPSSVVAKLKFIENGVLNVKLNIFHKAVLQPT